MKNKICVYTCITGDYDNLNELENKEKGIDYYCFTNNIKITSKTWKVIYIENNGLDNHYLSRKIKILGHRIINKYAIAIWMDANVELKKPISEFLHEQCDLSNYSFCAFKHSLHNSIKEEADACIKLGKDKKTIIEKQMKYYKKEEFPDSLGLYEMTVFVKKPRNLIVKKTMHLWFKMINEYSKRDQLSFMWCIYKTKLKIQTINLSIGNNEYFKWNCHKDSYFHNKFKFYYEVDGQFSEENSMVKNYVIVDEHQMKKRATFKLPRNCNSIRIDPAEYENYAVTDIKTNINGEMITSNILNIDGLYIFLNNDPSFTFNSEFRKKDHIEMEFRFVKLESRDYLELLKNNLDNK